MIIDKRNKLSPFIEFDRQHFVSSISFPRAAAPIETESAARSARTIVRNYGLLIKWQAFYGMQL